MADKDLGWVTREKLAEFFRERGVKNECEICGAASLEIIDAGDGELIGSLPAFGRKEDGAVDFWQSRHMQVARVMCINCGNVRLHALYAAHLWRLLPGAKPTTRGFAAGPVDEKEPEDKK